MLLTTLTVATLVCVVHHAARARGSLGNSSSSNTAQNDQFPISIVGHGHEG